MLFGRERNRNPLRSCRLLQMYKHSNNKAMTTGAIAAMLSTILYSRRFFPYYVYNIIGGLDEEGTILSFWEMEGVLYLRCVDFLLESKNHKQQLHFLGFGGRFWFGFVFKIQFLFKMQINRGRGRDLPSAGESLGSLSGPGQRQEHSI